MDNNIYYTTRDIYGIKLYNCIDEYKILFEQKYNTIISNEMMKETKAFYENLNEDIKKNIKFKIYKNCKSIDDDTNFMIWLNISLNEFIKEFDV